MNVVYEGLDVICKNAFGEVKIYAGDYDESTDEIRIRSGIRNDQLNRGWIGDLICSTKKAYNFESWDKIDDVEMTTYNDVLLASVTVYSISDRVITWEYRFLKK